MPYSPTSCRRSLDMEEAMRRTDLLSNLFSSKEADMEATDLFQVGSRRLALDGQPSLPIVSCDDVDIPPAFLRLLHEGDATAPCIPRPLSPAHLQHLHVEVKIEFECNGHFANTDIEQHEVRLIDHQCDTLAEQLRSFEEQRLSFELSLARLERALPTHKAWLSEQNKKLEHVQAAVRDPCSIIGPNTEFVEPDLQVLRLKAQALARENAEMEQEGLIKSLNACHAMEMLTTSLKFQNKWRCDAEVDADNTKQRAEAAQQQALTQAKEEERVLKELHDVTSRTSEAKRRMNLVSQRLQRLIPLPNGQHLSPAKAAELAAAVREELSRGVMHLLQALQNSDDYNVHLPFDPTARRPDPGVLTPVIKHAHARPQIPQQLSPYPFSPPAPCSPPVPAMYFRASPQVRSPSPSIPDRLRTPAYRSGNPAARSPTEERDTVSLRNISPPKVPPSRARSSSIPRARSESAESHLRIQSLQEQAQQQLAGVAATLRGMS
ncbi:hypothetical protein DIPPA_23527 [Diplonema papillatum]|nr:hypothetical protein DIPPA_23527 [Diplonema papillatum]